MWVLLLLRLVARLPLAWLARANLRSVTAGWLCYGLTLGVASVLTILVLSGLLICPSLRRSAIIDNVDLVAYDDTCVGI